MTYARCCDCGAHFVRDADAAWKVRCLACWVRRKNASPSKAPLPAHDPLRDEMREVMRPLLMLCHPDKHGNSPLSNRMTCWLLAVRNRLTVGTTA